MFNLSIIKTTKLKHLYAETSHLAIENVRLSKENAKLSVAVAELDSVLAAHKSFIQRMEGALDVLDKQNRYLKRVIGSRSAGNRKKRK